MQNIRQKMTKDTLILGSAYLLLLASLAWRLVMYRPDMNARGIFNWIEIFFLLLLYGYIHLTALGLGRIFLRQFDLPLSNPEFTLISYLLGLGALSIGVLFIGLAGWLTAGAIFAWLAIAGFVACREWPGIVRGSWAALRALHFQRAKNFYETLLQIVVIASVPLLLMNVLSPVWDYDALMYHLEIPRHFLEHKSIYFDPEIWRSAHPFLGEMLFIVGIVFKLEPLAKLINLTYAILFILSAYVFGKRFLGRETALNATGILIGAPAFLLWATWASIDFAWAAYEFWGIVAIVLWLADEKRNTERWLALAGMMSGLAASTKYLSAPALLMVGIIILWRSVQDAKHPVSASIRNLLTFGLSAGLVMGAWYLKNWLWTGNPVYPLIFGGPGWSPVENQLLNDYVYSFGVGKSWLDYLRLPYNVYAYHNQFSTIALEVIHPALWLAIFFPFLSKFKKHSTILVYTLLYCVLWALNSQQVRFLIPVTAFLAIFAGSVIESCPVYLKKFLKVGLLGGFMLFSLVYQILAFQNSGVGAYFSGQKSTTEVIQSQNNDFRMALYTRDSLESNAKVQFLWDGRGYYCGSRCIADDEQFTAVSLAINFPEPRALAQDLREKGITHLMLSKPDADWFIAYHDPRGLHRDALDYFQEVFLPACGKSVFSNSGMELFEITCP
jgi:hypothetical protein